MNRIRTVLIALALLPTCVVAPARAENVVRWATPTPAETFDPHGHDVLQTHWVQRHVYERLIDYDKDGGLEPALAASWKRLDAATWELELRRGVTFHDGTPFTSVDVVFSFERGKADSSSAKDGLSGIAKVEAVDADTVRFSVATSNPIPWDDLSGLPIMSKVWAERHGAVLPSQLGDDRWDDAETHANGTGPFMLEEFEPGERTVLVRNANWWGLAQHPHNIDRIVQTRVADPAQGAQLLLAGDIDFLQSPPPDQLERIAATPGLKVQKAESTQTLYLGFDQASPELRSSNVKGRNPFADRRVRQAFYQGIDIGRIIEALHGLGGPGRHAESGRRASAGRKSSTAACPTIPRKPKRFSPRPATLRASASGSTARHSRTSMPHDRRLAGGDRHRGRCRAPANPRARRKDPDPRDRFLLVGLHRAVRFVWWFKDRYRSDAEYAGTGYANPEVDALIDQIEGEMVTYVRDGLIEQVWRKVLGDIVYVPLFHPINAWALRADLDLPISI